MKITPTEYNYRWPTRNAKSLKHRLYSTSYTGSIELPELVHCFGRDYEYLSIGCYSQLLMGGWHYETQIIPDEWSGFSAGPILLPLGEPQVMKACGADVKLWKTSDDVVVLNFDVKDIKHKGRYMYQVQWPLREKNIVEFHYRSVQTGFATKVGAMDAAKNVAEWTDMKADWPYSKVALRIDTSHGTENILHDGEKPTEDPGDGYEWVLVSTPLGKKWVKKLKDVPNPMPQPTPAPVVKGWKTVYEDEELQVRRWK
jgi:hypothetical protein